MVVEEPNQIDGLTLCWFERCRRQEGHGKNHGTIVADMMPPWSHVVEALCKANGSSGCALAMFRGRKDGALQRE